MATYINNAKLSYTYAGSVPQTIQSNDVITTMQDVYSMNVTKKAAPQTYRLGKRVCYVILVTNTGSMAMNNVTLSDNLANGDLSFVPCSAQVIAGTSVTPVTPTSTSPLTITLPAALEPCTTAAVVYQACVNDSLELPLADLTNTVTVTAPGAAAVTATETICPEQYAELSITKSADQTQVAPGDTLNYTLNVTNSGTIPADNISIADSLPSNISSVNAVYLSVDGGTEVPTSDYSYNTETHLFILPDTGTQTVPAGGTLSVRIECTVGTPAVV